MALSLPAAGAAFRLPFVVCNTCAMQPVTGTAARPDRVDALLAATRDLVGVALRSLDVLDGAVSLPQFRLLVALDELGRTPSSRVAAFLGLGPSSVTRMVDRLSEAGLVARGGDPANRSVVTLELTERGRELVGAVLARRRAELGQALDRLTPDESDTVSAALRLLHEAIGAGLPDGAPRPTAGPVPL